MKIRLLTDGGVHITVSRHNLEQLQEALDHGNEGPWLSKVDADGNGHYLVIVAQENETHYKESE